MSNNKKILVLAALVIVLFSCVFLLSKKNAELDAIIYRNSVTDNSNKNNLEVEFEDDTMISVNAELDFDSAVLKEAIALAKSVAKDFIANEIAVSEIRVSDIYEVGSYSENNYNNTTMYNVELHVSPVDGERFTDDTNYMILLSRWDTDDKGIYVVSYINDEAIKEKYLDVANEDYAGDVYLAACSNELQAFYKRNAVLKQEELLNDAYTKALKYIESSKNDVKIQNINIDDVKVEENSIFIFDTDIEGVTIVVRYSYESETDAWAFYYATHII